MKPRALLSPAIFQPIQRVLPLAGLCFGLAGEAPAQTVFLDFNPPDPGLLSSFDLWNDVAGTNGGNYSFADAPSAGVGGSGGISVFQNTDTTADYRLRSWDFSTNGATLTLAVMIHADGQTSGDKVQFGVMNNHTNGLNNNDAVAFESFRFIPSSATTWSLREQYRTGGVLTENPLGTVNVAAGEWYQFVVTLTNTAGAAGNYSASCALYDFGADGLTPGTNVIPFSTVRSNTGQTDVTVPAVWPALRAFQDAGVDAWDNFLVFTRDSLPVILIPLPRNVTAAAGSSLTFRSFAEGPGTISYAWFTNGVQVAGAAGVSYTTPPLDLSYTNLAVVAANANGAVTNVANINVLPPQLAGVTNLPAAGIQGTFATLNGAVSLPPGSQAPAVTLYYGPADGGTNAAAWAQSVALGVQTGAFAQTVTGLLPNTTYYFTAQAINNAGATWAVPSQSFTTGASNLPPSFAAVLTQHNDNYRTGANLHETTLNIYNVNTNRFGLLYTLPVDDQIYAQPLVMTNVNLLGRGTRNLLIVCTVNDTVYAFDADAPGATPPIWTRSFLAPPNVVPPRNTDMTGACGGNYKDFTGNIGIVSTPVIDPASGTLYVLARTREISGNTTNFVQRLHALDVATGAERPNSPVVVSTAVPGTGDGGNGIVFNPQKQNQRCGLALVNGVVYLAWASHCDWGPYHGWVIGYNATTLQRVVAWVDTPNGSEGGIWMSGAAPAADENGNLYLVTGNGTVDATDYGESFLKLTPNNGTLLVSSWFTPYNWQALNNSDLDLGNAGLLLIPGTNLAISGGKAGVLYLVNRDQMGGLSSGTADTNIVQSWSPGSGQLHGGPVWWRCGTNSFLYLWPQSGNRLKQFQFTNGLFNTTPYAQGPTLGGAGSPGGILSLSADGTNADTGILWATVNTTSSANQATVAGTLRAYEAKNVTNELWNSDLIPARDALGNLAKFVPPTVANGRVYMATFSDRLNVYGLFPPPVLSIHFSDGTHRITWPTNTPAGFTLQVSTNLALGDWLDMTNGIVATNGVYQVTLPLLTNTAAFYRLKLQ